MLTHSVFAVTSLTLPLPKQLEQSSNWYGNVFVFDFTKLKKKAHRETSHDTKHHRRSQFRGLENNAFKLQRTKHKVGV